MTGTHLDHTRDVADAGCAGCACSVDREITRTDGGRPAGFVRFLLSGRETTIALAAGVALLLTACLAQAEVPTTGDTGGSDTTPPLPPSLTSEPTQEPGVSTPLPPPTIVPSLPDCPSGALLYTQSYGQDAEGRTLWKVYWACSGNSAIRLLASRLKAHRMAVSPKGDRVAFSGEVIQVMDISSREMVTFLEGVPNEDIFYPSWSPDGEYIVFLRYRSVPNRPPEEAIEVIHLPSGSVSKGFIPSEYEDQLTHATISGVAWLPQGDRILVYGNVTQDLYLLDVVCDSTSHLCVADNMREIPASRSIKEAPTVSPDGTRIAALCIIPGTHPPEITLCILDFNGNVIHEFDLEDWGLDYVYGLAWSPDGSRIAFDDIGRIYILSLSDQSLTKLDVVGSQPVWLP